MVVLQMLFAWALNDFAKTINDWSLQCILESKKHKQALMMISLVPSLESKLTPNTY